MNDLRSNRKIKPQMGMTKKRLCPPGFIPDSTASKHLILETGHYASSSFFLLLITTTDAHAAAPSEP